jgi:hypothetical protein
MIKGISAIKNLESAMLNITISFGMNPLSGGIPANESREMITMALLVNLSLKELYILLIDLGFLLIKDRNTGITIIEYIIKYEEH